MWLQMGCMTIDGVMYSLRRYVRGAISRTPYPATVENVDFGSDTYRLIPVDLNLSLDDEPRHAHHGQSEFYSYISIFISPDDKTNQMQIKHRI